MEEGKGQGNGLRLVVRQRKSNCRRTFSCLQLLGFIWFAAGTRERVGGRACIAALAPHKTDARRSQLRGRLSRILKKGARLAQDSRDTSCARAAQCFTNGSPDLVPKTDRLHPDAIPEE
jgi:hypothetical protein